MRTTDWLQLVGNAELSRMSPRICSRKGDCRRLPGVTLIIFGHAMLFLVLVFWRVENDGQLVGWQGGIECRRAGDLVGGDG